MQSQLKILSTIWFLTGLSILLLNDFVLKGIYGNWLTGKLSDFSGLFIFPLFWTAIFPKYKVKFFWLTGLLFIYFKLPHSQALIDIWNSLGLIKISRVVDYTDFFALTILPLAFLVETKSQTIYKFSINPIIPMTISAFAFLATSETSATCFDEGSAVYHLKQYSRDSLISKLKRSGLIVTFTEYNNTKYKDQHCEIHNLKDTIDNLVVIIGDFNKDDSTVELSLGCWDIGTDVSSDKLPKQVVEKQKQFVQRTFESEVIGRIKNDNH